MKLTPGDLVVVPFPGATGTKRRPAVVVSTELYQAHHPDVILGLLTTQISSASTPTDCSVRDWRQAGLHQPSAFRCYFGLPLASEVEGVIGHLSDRDWQAVQTCLQLAIAGPSSVAPTDKQHDESTIESDPQ